MAPLPETPTTRVPPHWSWSPYKLEDGSWGSSYLGDAVRLPADLEGATIEIKTRGGEILIRTVVEVVERTAEYILVRDSGKG